MACGDLEVDLGLLSSLVIMVLIIDDGDEEEGGRLPLPTLLSCAEYEPDVVPDAPLLDLRVALLLDEDRIDR